LVLLVVDAHVLGRPPAGELIGTAVYCAAPDHQEAAMGVVDIRGASNYAT
jgi:hypothetical protein